MKTFEEMDLPESLINTLQHMKFHEPTPIQVEAIPLALQGQDILGTAQTGTGKTGAFGIPLVKRLLSDSSSSALVMTPTRELATQVMSQLHAMLGKKSKIKSALLIGGESMSKQLTQLRNRPCVIVGTPGRVKDHLMRKSLILHDFNFLVLDEADRMLDMGFMPQIDHVIKYMAPKRQTLLFSATLPKKVIHIAKKYLNNPARVAVNKTSSPTTNIKQSVLRIRASEKCQNLLMELDKRKGSVIIFVRTKFGSEKLAKKLLEEGHSADAIHGNLSQNKRNHVLSAFRKKKRRILVATDVASRGLDVPHIEHVINYDIPQCADDYIHRIGRTARAGALGEALILITPADKGKWKEIERLLNPELEQEPEHFETVHVNKKKHSRGKQKGNIPIFHKKKGIKDKRTAFKKES